MANADRTGKSPAFQFYPKDFLSSSKVQRMSLSERGAYITLLSFCWLDGSLPTDIGEIASIVGVPRNHFGKLWAGPLRQCFTEKNGRLVNDRLEDERKKQAKWSKQQKDRAEQGWAKRKLHSAGNATALQSPQSSGNALLLQSASASAISRERGAPIHSTHRNHAACGRVCVPSFLHSEFVQRRGNESDLDALYTAVLREWGPDGARAKDEPGDPVVFWRARYDEKWPAAIRPRPVNGKVAPGDAWRPEGQ